MFWIVNMWWSGYLKQSFSSWGCRRLAMMWEHAQFRTTKAKVSSAWPQQHPASSHLLQQPYTHTGPLISMTILCCLGVSMVRLGMYRGAPCVCVYECVHRSKGAPSVVHPWICVCEMEAQGSWGLCFGEGGLFSGDPEVKAVGPSQAGVTASTQFRTPSMLDLLTWWDFNFETSMGIMYTIKKTASGLEYTSWS